MSSLRGQDCYEIEEILSAQGPEFYLQRLRPRLGQALLPPNSPVTDVPETPSPPPGPEMADHVALPVVQATRLDLAVAPFDGQKRNFRTFLRSLRLLFMANLVVYATDLAKVLFALSKITGEGFAAEWANMKAEEILGNGEAGTWAEFVEELKRAFDDLNDRATALAGIASLKQGALAAPEFFANFETLFQRAEMDEVGDSDILVHWLELNLSRRLVGKIYGVSPMPETYVQWKALAERLDAQQRCFDGVIVQQNYVPPDLPTTNRPPCPQPPFAPAALPRALAPAPRPILAQPQARTPAPPIMLRPASAGDAMLLNRPHAPGVGRTCFGCGEARPMVRDCLLPDSRPQIPRPQVHAVESQARSTEDYENEIALLRDRLELLEREKRAPIEEPDFGDEAQ